MNMLGLFHSAIVALLLSSLSKVSPDPTPENPLKRGVENDKIPLVNLHPPPEDHVGSSSTVPAIPTVPTTKPKVPSKPRIFNGIDIKEAHSLLLNITDPQYSQAAFLERLAQNSGTPGIKEAFKGEIPIEVLASGAPKRKQMERFMRFMRFGGSPLKQNAKWDENGTEEEIKFLNEDEFKEKYKNVMAASEARNLKPTEKQLSASRGNGLIVATASMMGLRSSHEDYHANVLSIKHLKLVSWAFSVICDGHAGVEFAKISAEQLLPALLQAPEFSLVDGLINDEGVLSARTDVERRKIAIWLKRSFLRFDARLRGLDEDDNLPGGTTVIVAIITPTHVIFVNLGDARGIFAVGNKFYYTEDHKPECEEERINEAGYEVRYGRVDGCLAVSRALGDFEFKAEGKLAVSPEPDVYLIDRPVGPDAVQGEVFVVIGCDGIYEKDMFTRESLVTFIHEQLKIDRDPKRITSAIIDKAYNKGKGSKDNMSVSLLLLK